MSYMSEILITHTEKYNWMLSCVRKQLFLFLRGGIWSFLGPPPRETGRPWASAANGILFWALTKLFSPFLILQEELPDTQQSANPLPMATRSPMHR